MKIIRNNKIAIGLFFAVFSIFFCTKIEHNNPLYDDYEGVYKFDITWNKDSFDIFCMDSIEFDFTGVDTFATFVMVTEKNDTISDYAKQIILNASQKNISHLHLYFTKPFSSKVWVNGIRPNGKIGDSHSGTITVKNPFGIVDGDTTIGFDEELVFSITRNGAKFNSEILKAEWKYSLSGKDSIAILPWNKTYNFSGTKNGNHSFVVTLDDGNNRYKLKTFDIDVRGYRPVIDTAYVINHNPFCGERLSFAIAIIDNDDTPNKITVQTDKDSFVNFLKFQPYDSMVIVKADDIICDTGMTVFKIQIADNSGLFSKEYLCSSYINFILPNPILETTTDDTIIFPLGDTVNIIPCHDETYTSGTRYIWKYKNNYDTTDYCASFTIAKLDTTAQHLSVVGLNKYGYFGSKCNAWVKGNKFEFIIKDEIFPDTIRGKELATFAMSVVDSLGNPYTDDVEYFWSFKPDSVWDSLYIDKDTCRLIIKDTATSFYLSVYAKVGNNIQTNIFTKRIIHKIDRPICLFDTSYYTYEKYDSAQFKFSASDIDGVVDSVFLLFIPGNDTILLGNNSVYDTMFTYLDTLLAQVWAKDNDGYISKIDSAIVVIYSHELSFIPDTLHDTVFLFDTLSISLKVNMPNRVHSYLWDIDDDGLWDTSTQSPDYSHYVGNIGDNPNNTIIAGCVTKNKYNTSVLDTTDAKFVLFYHTLEGNPVITKSIIKKPFIYIKDKTEISVTVIDTNNSIKRVYIETSKNGNIDTLSQEYDTKKVTALFKIKFNNAGTFNFRTWAIDASDLTSDTIIVDSFLVVDQGIPVVKSIHQSSIDPIYINDSTQFTIRWKDNNSIVKYEYSLDTANSFMSIGIDSSFYVSFSNIGEHIIYARVTDNDDNRSEDFSDTFEVYLGRPLVDSLVFDKDTCYIFDTNNCNVFYSDNGSIIKVEYATNTVDTIDSGNVVFEDKNSSDNFDLIFKTPGWKYVFVRVTDDDSVVSDIYVDSIFVKPGTPVINSISIDTNSTFIFINDKRKFTINYTDPNNTPIDTFMIDFDGDGIFDTSGDSSVFYWTYNINDVDSVKNVIVMIEDMHGMKDCDTLGINIIPGYPEIWGDDGDTLWVVVDNNYGNYPLYVNSNDSNGAVETFYWSWSGGIANAFDSTDIDNISYGVNNITIHNSVNMWIYGRDDDGLVSGGKFLIYADSVPLEVTGLNFAMTSGNDSVIVMWGLELDEIDGLDTEIKIMIKYSNVGDPDVVLKDFMKAENYEVNQAGTKRLFKYEKTQTGDVRWKVVLRDKRGSETASEANSFTIP